MIRGIGKLLEVGYWLQIQKHMMRSYFKNTPSTKGLSY
jgi:hypothetical protein